MDEHQQLALQLIEGVVSADEAAIAACFAPQARFRALIPPDPIERHGASAAGAVIAGWFADVDPLTLVDQSVDHVADRLHVSYLLHGTENGEDFTVQQQVYAELSEGRLNDVTLLCSGFRPRASSLG